MRIPQLIASTLLVIVSVAPLSALAADSEALPDGGDIEGQTAQQCLTDLRAFDNDLALVGFGVLAPGGYNSFTGLGPPYGMTGTPRQRMQSLRDAAYVFAADGNEQLCQTVLASMRQIYQDHQELVGTEYDDPNARAVWRRAHLAQATPVTGMDRLMRADIIIGADIRTPDDQTLGEIEDIVLDPQQQTVAYVLASRGGFLGLGEELVAVRWADLRVTSDHEIYVLDASPEEFAAAPTLDRRNFEESSGNAWRSELDQYWAEIVENR